MRTDLSLKELLELPPVDRERPHISRGLSPRVRISLIIGMLACIILPASVGIFFYLTRPVIPDVIGLETQEAQEIASGAHVRLDVAGTLFSVEPAGTIVEQTPEAGERPFFRRTVSAILSSGKQSIEVPHLTGETRIRAESILKHMGLQTQVVYEYTPDAIGKVLSTQPEEGVTVQTGDAIALRVGAPQSQVSLVEYDLHDMVVAISISPLENAALSDDIALRLASLLRAAQATVHVVTWQDSATSDIASEKTLPDGVSAYIRLMVGNHPANILYVQENTSSEDALASSALARRVLDQLRAIPTRAEYKTTKESLLLPRCAVVSFGNEGNFSLYKDSRWKDNVARSLYLAIGQTLVR